MVVAQTGEVTARQELPEAGAAQVWRLPCWAIEGAIVQSASWTLYEQVRFDRRHITSRDWGGYPILRFPAVPDSIEVHIADRPGSPFLGTGEAGQGPTAAAIANALCDAAGVRLRDLPLSQARVKDAVGV